MRHTYNYVIKISHEYNETFKTESGLELYGDKRFSQKRLANQYATIVGQPLLYEGDLLEVGTKVFIDPVFFHSISQDDSIQYTVNSIDRDKGLYSIEPQNIIMYEDGSDWKGYLMNWVGKNKIENKEKTQGSIVIETKTKKRTDYFEVVYPNKFLSSNKVNTGDVIFVKDQYFVPFWIEGVEYHWVKDRHTLAKVDG